MPDLSNLLGAVYGDGPSTSRDPEDEAHVEKEPAAHERGPAVPDWADDEHLDAAFAQWKPGPSEDATPAEHAFVHDADEDPAPPLADDLAAALSEALVAASGTADDTADPTADKPHFDFSVDEDDQVAEAAVDEHVVEPHDLEPSTNLSKYELAPVEPSQTEQVHELGEVSPPEADSHPEPEPVAVEPVAVEPVAVEPVEAPIAEHPVPEFAEPELAEPEPAHAADEPEPVHAEDEPVAAPVAEHEPEVDEQDEPEVDNWPTSTHRRAAAAELTATSRIEPDSVDAAPAPMPVHEPEPVAAMPTAPLPEPVLARSPVAGDGADAPTTVPVGMRRWERSDDDILPTKAAKKFFSLRRG